MRERETESTINLLANASYFSDGPVAIFKLRAVPAGDSSNRTNNHDNTTS